MQSFEIESMSPVEFVAEVREGLASRGFERHLRVSVEGDVLTVEFRWMGTTRFEYRIEELDAGFRARFLGQRVAPLHAAFSDRFEGYFERALSELGARVV
jgi:hypothetical protein